MAEVTARSISVRKQSSCLEDLLMAFLATTGGLPFARKHRGECAHICRWAADLFVSSRSLSVAIRHGGERLQLSEQMALRFSCKQREASYSASQEWGKIKLRLV